MDSFDSAGLQKFLTAARIERVSTVGRQLGYATPAARSVVVHFVEQDFPEYVHSVWHIVLSSVETWVLVSRYGDASQLIIPGASANAAAVRFDAEDRGSLCAYLSNNGPPKSSGSRDVYMIGGSGWPLITWDHHWDEGMNIQFSDVREASKLLSALNDFGTELEVFYNPG